MFKTIARDTAGESICRIDYVVTKIPFSVNQSTATFEIMKLVIELFEGSLLSAFLSFMSLL